MARRAQSVSHLYENRSRQIYQRRLDVKYDTMGTDEFYTKKTDDLTDVKERTRIINRVDFV